MLATVRAMGRETSDEEYVLQLCDELLGEVGLRQHLFDWLLGDPGKHGSRRRLPVDGYWPGHRVVVEYRELQHGSSDSAFRQARTHDGEWCSSGSAAPALRLAARGADSRAWPPTGDRQTVPLGRRFTGQAAPIEVL